MASDHRRSVPNFLYPCPTFTAPNSPNSQPPSPPHLPNSTHHDRNSPLFPCILFLSQSSNCQPDVAEKVALYCESHSTPLPQDIERHKKFTRENFRDHDKMVSSLEVPLPLLSLWLTYRPNCSSSWRKIVVQREVLPPLYAVLTGSVGDWLLFGVLGTCMGGST